VYSGGPYLARNQGRRREDVEKKREVEETTNPEKRGGCGLRGLDSNGFKPKRFLRKGRTKKKNIIEKREFK